MRLFLYLADHAAEARQAELLRGHRAAPRAAGRQLPVQFDGRKFFRSPPAHHVLPAFPQPEHEIEGRIENAGDQKFVVAYRAHRLRPFFGSCVNSFNNASILSKLPLQNFR